MIPSNCEFTFIRRNISEFVALVELDFEMYNIIK